MSARSNSPQWVSILDHLLGYYWALEQREQVRLAKVQLTKLQLVPDRAPENREFLPYPDYPPVRSLNVLFREETRFHDPRLRLRVSVDRDMPEAFTIYALGMPPEAEEAAKRAVRKWLEQEPYRPPFKTDKERRRVDTLRGRLCRAVQDRLNKLDGQRPRAARRDLTIYGDGKGSYRVGGSRFYCVSAEEDAILQAFSCYPSMDSKKLRQASQIMDRDATRVLRGLREKYEGAFAKAIRTPGKKGRGGYHADVKFLDSKT
jgi:hypothetical protein